MTYSIIARDERSGRLGVAVQSHFLAAAARVAGARAGAGVVATQANIGAAYRSGGLDLLAGGASADEALAVCMSEDPQPEVRQVAMMDARGEIAVHTGAGCWNAAAHHVAPGVAAQANMVASPAIPQAMVAAFQAHTGSFPERLLAALDAAEQLGGDLRGRQAAGILIVEGDAEVDAEPVLDLRVDDDAEPLVRLRSAVARARAFVPMWDVIRGPACRGPVPPAADESVHAIEVLGTAQREYGRRNLEPSFWRAVALWRAGRQKEARVALDRIARDNSGWTMLFDDVVSRWPIP